MRSARRIIEEIAKKKERSEEGRRQRKGWGSRCTGELIRRAHNPGGALAPCGEQPGAQHAHVHAEAVEGPGEGRRAGPPLQPIRGEEAL